MQVSALDSAEDGSARENNLYVKHLPPDIDDAGLERMFNVCQLKRLSLAPDIMMTQPMMLSEYFHLRANLMPGCPCKL